MANQPFRFEPIVPKGPIHKISKRKVVDRLGDAVLSIVNRMGKYPPSRTEYRRTGTLGRGWAADGPRSEGSDLVATAGNKVIYAPFVQGLKNQQVKWAQPYGWESVETAGEEEWRKHKPLIEKALQEK